MYKQDGLSNADRLNTALVTTPFKIHDLSTLELLSGSRQLGKFIKYFNNENAECGTWSDIFENDELGIIAEITMYDCNKIVNEIMLYVRSSSGTTDIFKKGINRTFGIIRTIDRWYAKLSRINREVAKLFLMQMKQLIDSQFSSQYVLLLSIVKKIADDQQNISIPEMYGPLKNVTYERVEVCKESKYQGLFCNIIYSLYAVITSIKKFSEMYYVDSLKRSDHSPDIALFLTFLQIFKNIQEQINTIPEKYVRHYYEKILKFSRNQAISDNVYVTLKCNSRENGVCLPKGTEFIADVNGEDTVYISNKDVFIRPVEIHSICSIYLEKGRYKEPEKTLGYYSKLWAVKNTIADSSKNCAQLFSFKKMSDDSTVHNGTNIGLAIASKIFYLSEGERKIRCTFTITNNRDIEWYDELKEKFLKADGLPEDEDSWKHEFIKYFKTMFLIEVTTEAGWYVVEMYQPNSSAIDHSCSKNSLQFEFVLPVNAPPVTSYDTSIHGHSFTSNLPICKMTLNDNAEIFPYSLLKNLIASEVQIDVSVRGATGLSLYNQYGPIESSTPFTPFGTIPKKGEKFIIGYHELADKSVSSVDLEIEWGNVPWQQNGFSEVYEGYSFPFNNNSFKVRISELRDGIWTDLDGEEKEAIVLYETAKDNQKSESGIGPVLSNKKIADIKVHNFRELPIPDLSETFQYSSKIKNRFLQMTLIAPDCGFGQQLYTNDLASAFTKKLHNKNNTKLPGEPYFPVINKMTLNYHAKTTLRFSKSASSQMQNELVDSFYYIMPFGIRKVCPGSGCVSIRLAPPLDCIEHEGSSEVSFYIGLKGESIDGELSLFFKINDDVVSAFNKKIQWYILSNDKWIYLEQKNILSDTTCELSITGVITFHIPGTITSNNTIMPSGLYWIRGVADTEIENFSSIYTIDVNGAQLIRKSCGNEFFDTAKPLSTCIIKDLAKQVAGIETVTQQTASAGGLKEETTPEFMTRVSETLRHKKRFVTAYDYETAILENIKDVYKVKCFSPVQRSDSSDRCAGKITICVIPSLKSNDGNEYQCPKFPLYRLHEIEQFLKKYTSPVVNLNVINPEYEQIQIRCSIEPDDLKKRGNLINTINKEISDYISPWNSKGNCTAFGWRIVITELKKFIHEIHGVKRVTCFSVLYKKTLQSNKYLLDDTAEQCIYGNNQNSIESKIPWSICVPFEKHEIEIIDDNSFGTGKVAGISRMEIGNVFIVKGQNHGDTKQKNT
jgi:hypothetical protein